MRNARELKQMAILGFAGLFGLAAIGGFVNQSGWPTDVGAVHLRDNPGSDAANHPLDEQAPSELLADDDRIRRVDDDSFGFDGFDDEDDDVDLDSTLDATNTGGLAGGANTANTANTGDGDNTRGDDGTSGGNNTANTANTASAANTAHTGDGDNTRGDDGTSGGNNTADNDTQSRGGTT